MILKTMITCSKNSVDHKCNCFFTYYRGGSKNFATSKMELFMVIGRGYILDMTRFLGLSLDYVTALFIGLVLCRKVFYIIGSIFVKSYSVKYFFNAFEIMRRLHMDKYQIFWSHLIYLNISALHKAKTYTKIFTLFQITRTSRVISLISRLVYILQTRKIFAMRLAKMI